MNGKKPPQIMIALITFLIVSCVNQPNIPETLTLPLKTPETVPTQDNRSLTYYTAKQAYAHLVLYLNEKSQPLPNKIWYVLPSQSNLYFNKSRNEYSGLVGGWVIAFTDQQESSFSATVNCFGEILIEEIDDKLLVELESPFREDEWVLDNTDAHISVLTQGGVGKGDRIGGWLMSFPVVDRGARPVWSGGAWFMPEGQIPISVDAQTGELYKPADNNSLEPLIKIPTDSAILWQGGYDEESIEAILTWSDQYYLRPYSYQYSHFWYIYNRELLRAALQDQISIPDRDASSWFTTGTIHGVLGEWVEAIHDLTNAVELDPGNSEYIHYRGVMYLIVRELEKAKTDFESLPVDNKDRVDSLENVSLLQGGDREGFLAKAYYIPTNIGILPLQLWIGPVPLSGPTR
jgi:tetratricopeptide (TPR) repeat protein